MTEIQRLQLEITDLRAQLAAIPAVAAPGWARPPITHDGLVVAVWSNEAGTKYIEGGSAVDFGDVDLWMPLPPIPEAGQQ